MMGNFIDANKNLQELNKTLRKLVKNGRITADDAELEMAKEIEKQELQYAKDLEGRLRNVHSAPISKGTGNDKRWKTRIIRNDGTPKQLAKVHLVDLEKALYWHYYQTLPPTQDAKITVETLYPDYLKRQQERGCANTTVVRYEKDWKNHCSKCPFIHKSVTEITVDELEAWALSLINEGNMSKTNYYNITGIIRGILDIAVKRNLISRNPWNSVDPGDLRKNNARKKHERATEDLECVDAEVISASDMSRIKEYAWSLLRSRSNHIRNPLGILAVLFTMEQGLRVGEICALKHADLKRSDSIHICRMLRDQGSKCREIVPYTKGYRDRLIPLSEASKEILEYARCLQQEMGITSEYIFSWNQGPLTYRTPGRVLAILCRDQNIPHKHIHSIRKTVTTVLVDSGCYTPATIAKIMGNSVEVIYKYYYLNREDLDSICRNYDEAVTSLYQEQVKKGSDKN